MISQGVFILIFSVSVAEDESHAIYTFPKRGYLSNVFPCNYRRASTFVQVVWPRARYSYFSHVRLDSFQLIICFISMSSVFTSFETVAFLRISLICSVFKFFDQFFPCHLLGVRDLTVEDIPIRSGEHEACHTLRSIARIFSNLERVRPWSTSGSHHPLSLQDLNSFC